LRFFVLEKDSLQVCLGTVLVILCFLKKIHSEFVWGRCLRFFVFEEYFFPICLGTVLAILCVLEEDLDSLQVCLGTVFAALCFGGVLSTPSQFVWGRRL
jgi:hypothetical protein